MGGNTILLTDIAVSLLCLGIIEYQGIAFAHEPYHAVRVICLLESGREVIEAPNLLAVDAFDDFILKIRTVRVYFIGEDLGKDDVLFSLGVFI